MEAGGAKSLLGTTRESDLKGRRNAMTRFLEEEKRNTPLNVSVRMQHCNSEKSLHNVKFQLTRQIS